MNMMKALGIDHYNQSLTGDVVMTLKQFQGGDDHPLVLIIHEQDEDTDREEILRMA